MDGQSDFRQWDELLPDALGLVFKSLSLTEVLTVLPRVCKSWAKVITGPYCWQEIDIEAWGKNRKPAIVDRMLRLLISRSGGSSRKLVASGLTGCQSIFIADHAQSLQTLRLPRSRITDTIMETMSEKLSALKALDLSYCTGIGSHALEAIGKNCRSLSSLRRSVHQLDVIRLHSQEDEALAIATTMPKLKHLEIAYLLVTTSSVVEILKNCKHLELLDIHGCWKVDLDKEFLKGFEGLKVVGPETMDCFYGVGPGSNYPSAQGYVSWDFVAGVFDGLEDYDELEEMDGVDSDQGEEDEFEMWFYDNFDVSDASFAWPWSP